ncbi:hypothetical protein [Mesorhizobium sp. A556]
MHPAVTQQFAAALVEAGKTFDMLITPNDDHSTFSRSPYVEGRTCLRLPAAYIRTFCAGAEGFIGVTIHDNFAWARTPTTRIILGITSPEATSIIIAFWIQREASSQNMNQHASLYELALGPR